MPVSVKLRSRNSDANGFALRCGSGDYALRMVAQQVHQPALHKARRQVERDRWGHLAITVQVGREPENKYDKKVVRVTSLDGDTIGYLDADDAQEYYPLISAVENAGGIVHCNAVFFGGSSDKPTIGAWLDLKRPKTVRGLIGRLKA